VKSHDGLAEVSQSYLHGDDIISLDQSPHEVVLAIVSNLVTAGRQTKSMDVVWIASVPVPQGRELTGAVVEKRPLPKEVEE
jgi:hypothetical protein